MKSILSKLYTAWVLIVFTVFMILFLPGIIIPAFFGARAVSVTYFFMKLWSWVFSQLTFIRYEMIGRENIPKGKAFIYVSNHTSFLDLPGIAMTIRGQFRPLAKKELLKIPIFGWVTRATCVVVDRASAESRKKSIGYLKKILGYGISILIFPEGTQNRTKEIMQPFKDGAFRIALDTNQPLLPMVVLGAGTLMPPGKMQIAPGKIRIVVGKPIEVSERSATDINTLKDETFQLLKGIFEQHSLNK
ncbi:MAG: lysophospholipid acyltransferase family protein [Cyclobacteriaceae bacterium]|jgi:1-acyl-sn-glycerol-3-phosphate acyltransferase